MLTVTDPRGDNKIVSLDALKAELAITADGDDEYLSGLLDRISGWVETHCKRVFAVEGIQETLRISGSRGSLILSRYPVIEVSSIDHDGEVLNPDSIEIDKGPGMIFRLENDRRVAWSGKVTVTYRAGFDPIPGQVQQAVFDLVKLGQAARTRDPSLRSENILEGLYSYQLFLPTDTVGGMPANVAALLEPFIDHSKG